MIKHCFSKLRSPVFPYKFYTQPVNIPLRKISNSRQHCSHQLTAGDQEIIRLHAEAEKSGNIFYTDPQTGYLVRTKANHIQRGKCCGSACRHCPYDQVSVKDESNKKQFNGHFYK